MDEPINVKMSLSILFLFFTFIQTCKPSIEKHDSYPACCSYPCQHRGICQSGYDITSYSCDCTNTGYHGKQCEEPTWSTWFVNLFKPSKLTVHRLLVDWKLKPLFWIVNRIETLSNLLLGANYVDRAEFHDQYGRYDSLHEYINFDAAVNKTLRGRILPPVPTACPTPLGVVGAKQFPPIETIVALFERKAFKPCPLKTNGLFLFYAQYFTHQYFRTSYELGVEYTTTWAHGVDLTQLYGIDLETQRKLRSMVDGKMKMQEINGESYPPSLKDADIKMDDHTGAPPEKRFAMGHPFFSIMPGLLMYATIWLREHNRVATIMKSLHPAWDDERLFQTTRMILIAEMIQITIEQYVQHLSNYNIDLKYRPEVLHGKPFQYQNKITAEFNFMYRWHALVPDYFIIGGVNYTTDEMYGNLEILPKHGMNEFVDGLINTRAGQITHGNHHKLVRHVIKDIITDGRTLRMQSYNNYRRHYDLPAYKSFEEMVGEDEAELATTLRNLYGDIEAMELVPGFFLEKRLYKGMFGELILTLGASSAVTGLFSDVVGSPKFWKPSTFGGEVGFNIVKTSTLQKLFCNNIKSGKPCPDIVFEVPEGVEESNKEL